MNEIKNSAYILYNNALSYIKKNNITEAIKLLEQSIKIHAGDADILTVLGLCHYNLCDFKRARFFWLKSLELSKENNRCEAYLYFLGSEDFKELHSKYDSGLEKVNEMKFVEATHLFDNIIDKYPNLVEPYLIAGLCFYQLKNHTKAEEYWKTAKVLDEGNQKATRYLNEVRIILSKIKHKSYKRQLGIILVVSTLLFVTACLYLFSISKNSELEKKYSKVLLEKGISDKEITLIKEQIKKPESVKSNSDNNKISSKSENSTVISIKNLNENEYQLFKSAVEFYKRKDYQKAKEKFELILNYGIEKNLLAESLYFKAYCSEKTNDFEGAIEHYQEYIKKYPGWNYYDDSIYYCSILLYKSGRISEAKELLNCLINEKPNSIFINSKIKAILEK